VEVEGIFACISVKDDIWLGIRGELMQEGAFALCDHIAQTRLTNNILRQKSGNA